MKGLAASGNGHMSALVDTLIVDSPITAVAISHKNVDLSICSLTWGFKSSAQNEMMISPEDRVTSGCCLAQVDSALLSHPLVTEAVSFGAPDEKYGETVAAAVVLSQPADNVEATVADIKKAAAAKLARFKVYACSQRRELSCL